MNQLAQLKDALLVKYHVDCDQFIELYEQGLNREQMEVELNCTSFKLRMIASALNLRWASKYRVNDLALLHTRDAESGNANQAEEIIRLKENVLEYERELMVRDKGLARVRREANRLRAQMREESIEDTILEVIQSVVSKVEPLPKEVVIPSTVPSTDGVDFVVLSDFHIGATVNTGDVPDNEYNWEIAKGRLEHVMTTAMVNKKHSTFHFYILGDMLDGLIHDSLEACDMNPAESAKELAYLLGAYIAEFSAHYDSVNVYCLNGNHSRLTDKIKSVAKGFDFEFLCYSILEVLVQNNVDHFEISTVGMIAAEVAPGVFAGLHHGDNFRSGKKLDVLERFRQIGPEVSHVIQGHTHIFKADVLPTGGYYITNGSLIGTNGYVHTNGFIPVTTVQVIGKWGREGQLEALLPVSL